MRLAVAASVLAAVAACHSDSPTPPGPPGPSAAPAPAAATSLAQSGITPAWLDRKADPCTDFYQYACGGFLATAQIPADRDNWGTTEILIKDTEDYLHGVLEAAAHAGSGRDRDPLTEQLGAYYAACMDTAAIAQAGTQPIAPLLAQIAAVTDAPSAAQAVIAMHAEGLSPLFSLGPRQDFADATQVIAGIDQAGLALPDRKYYLEDTGTLAKTRAVYQAHQIRMFQLLGQPAAEAHASAAEAYRIETALAQLQQDEVTRRDPHKVYHRVERAGLEQAAPGFPWGAYLAQLGIPQVTAITVDNPAYYTAVTQLLAKESPAALRAYLTWALIAESADDLGSAWVDEKFVMTKELSGIEQQPPRWRTCVQRTDGDLGELLAQPYVRDRFPGDSRARASELGKEIFAAMRAELGTLPWMDDATRTAARAKLDQMGALVGYPDKWRSYAFPLSRTDYAANRTAATHAELARQLAKIGKPVDRADWAMTPPTVNAYFDNSLDQLVMPAGVLQVPFFGMTAHPAVNFGAAGGGTFGHEMTHGFDDEGSQFDAGGNLRQWWSPATSAKFAVATKCIVDQYSRYEAVPGVHLDGKLTAGENIADNGGVKLGYQAYTAWRAHQATPVPRAIEGISDDQLYFLGYGQSWCEKVQPKALETQAHSDPHSPGKWRVDGVVVNQPAFAAAFTCAPGTPMNPGAASCSVW